MINKFLPNPCVVRNFVGLIGLAAAPALASAGSVVYQAKIVCGVDPAGVVARIVPGHYLTSVGIQNPAGRKAANLKMRVALTFPPAAAVGVLAEPGPVSDVKTAKLNAYEALEVSCDQIFGDGVNSAFFSGLPQRPNNTPFPYFEGFLIIEADRPVSVAETHTASADSNSAVSSISVQHLQPVRK
ncbi:hypothetical protein ABZN20_18405 [Methylococcus sp. ANG]|jgi:hypothetical protein|uniref:hypothetical protein n=1 Tax=Methylococcus sp. ANG TaxID=3231903 RepID=UPI00345778B3